MVPLGDWLAFPSHAFLLAGDPDAPGARFGSAGLMLSRIGTLDVSAALRLRAGEHEELVWDLSREALTGMRPS